MSCNEWKTVKLGDVADVLSGYAFKTKDFIEEGVPVVKIKNIIPPNIDINDTQYVSNEMYEEKIKYALNYNDILISMTGSNVNQIASAVGKIGRVKLKYTKLLLNQRVGKLFVKDNSKCNYDYLYYYLIQPEIRYNLAANAGGSANQANISPADIKNIDIKLPSLEEQEKIVNILSCLDDKIELNNEMNKTLEEMAQSIFKRWFVDFEFPNENGEPYKSSGGEMVDSELGMIPNGWEVVNYINTSDIQYGFAFKSKLFNDKEGKPIIRIRDISNSYTPTYTTEEYNDLYIVTKNDILVGMDGEFKAHIWGGKDSLLNQRVLRIRPKDNNSIAYSYFSIKEPLRYLENSKVGTTVIHLGKKDIDNIKIVYPPNNLISKYRDIADNLINKICENKVEIMELLELRDSLLPKLMSGEIKVN